MTRKMNQGTWGGFTLIELLIVVAIIAVLAAIAVPNFLEAQVRAKVSRTKSDLRTQAMACETYAIDWSVYPKDSDSSLDTIGGNAGLPGALQANGVVGLTTPIAYMTGMLSDPFATVVGSVGSGMGAMGYRIASGTWSYTQPGMADNQKSYEVFQATGKKHAFAIIGVGPDKARCRMGYKCFPFEPANDPAEGPVGTTLNAAKGNMPNCWTDYDPSNGTISLGDVYYFGGNYQEGRFCRNGALVGQAYNKWGGPVW